MIGEELEYMEEAEHHPVSEPSEFKRLLFTMFFFFRIFEILSHLSSTVYCLQCFSTIGVLKK